MTTCALRPRYVAVEPKPHLTRPVVQLQPILARPGKPSVDLEALAKDIAGIAELRPLISIESPGHWEKTVAGLGDDIDAILPLSIPCYPTEIWNSHPRPLVARGLPVLFWPLVAFDEPDFWRWSAVDFLKTLGVDVHLVKNKRAGLALLRALGLKRMLRGSSMVVFGTQNFPWNATAIGHRIT
ncbi:MAG: hypothetical protein GF331_01665, partial [Chitinivibrionales bacterium]|nr:hypothetical protein [Chitinivibrionales bacterium]